MRALLSLLVLPSIFVLAGSDAIAQDSVYKRAQDAFDGADATTWDEVRDNRQNFNAICVSSTNVDRFYRTPVDYIYESGPIVGEWLWLSLYALHWHDIDFVGNIELEDSSGDVTGTKGTGTDPLVLTYRLWTDDAGDTHPILKLSHGMGTGKTTYCWGR